MILVRAAAGLVIELGAGPMGLFDNLTVKLADGLSRSALTFEVKESGGRLSLRPLEARQLSELLLYLGAIAANEGQILAEVCKYQPPGG
jgi:hypothetical protein